MDETVVSLDDIASAMDDCIFLMGDAELAMIKRDMELARAKFQEARDIMDSIIGALE